LGVYPNPTVALSRKTHLSETFHRGSTAYAQVQVSDVDAGDLGTRGGGSHPVTV